MGANAVTAGDKIQLSQLDALFTRLYNLTNTHKNSSAQINASAIPAAQASSGLSAGSPISAVDGKIALLKTELANLAKSKWYKSSTSGTVVQMTDFSTSFSVPTQGAKALASDFNLIENAITAAEQIIPVYSSKYSGQYTGCYSGCYGYQYSGKYSGQYTTCYFGCYGYQYLSRYLSQYAGCYGYQYSGRYSGQYTSRYSGQYTGQYSGCYGYQYSGKYTGQYSGCYGYQYSGKYGYQYLNKYSGKYSARYATYVKAVQPDF